VGKVLTFAAAFRKTFFEALPKRGRSSGESRGLEKNFQQVLGSISKAPTFAVPLAEMSARRVLKN
jgi:hypothetical protein